MNRLRQIIRTTFLLGTTLCILVTSFLVTASSPNDPINTLPGYTALAFVLALSVIPLIRVRKRRAERKKLENNSS